MPDCPSRAPRPSLPAGMTIETASHHPRFKHLLEDTAPCALQAGHEPPHQASNGLLRWYDPPIMFVGGLPFNPNTDE